MIIKSPITGKSPRIHPSVFIANNADIIGDVEIGEGSNIWFGAVIRGDQGRIIIGKNCSIQDNSVIHTEEATLCHIGNYVTIAHLAMIHGPAIIGDSTTIGIGAVVLQDCTVGSGCILGGGSILTKKMEDLTLYAGSPAVYKKSYPDDSSGKWDIELYMKNAKKFKEAGLSQSVPEQFLQN